MRIQVDAETVAIWLHNAATLIAQSEPAEVAERIHRLNDSLIGVSVAVEHGLGEVGARLCLGLPRLAGEEAMHDALCQHILDAAAMFAEMPPAELADAVKPLGKRAVGVAADAPLDSGVTLPVMLFAVLGGDE